MPEEEYWPLKRRKMPWRELLPMSGIDPSVEKQFLASFIEKIEAIEYLRGDKPFEASFGVVDRLSSKHDCFLVSLRRNPDNLKAQLNWLGLAPHFKAILSGHSEADGYDVKIKLVKEYLGDGDGLIIGDTEADIVTGKRLGMRSVALTSGIRDEAHLRDLKPDYLLSGIGLVEKSGALG